MSKRIHPGPYIPGHLPRDKSRYSLRDPKRVQQPDGTFKNKSNSYRKLYYREEHRARRLGADFATREDLNNAEYKVPQKLSKLSLEDDRSKGVTITGLWI
jgi:hypothetical protein